jgi:uncharacterized protein YggE
MPAGAIAPTADVIHVVGYGSVKVQPDTGELNFTIRAQDLKPAVARAKATDAAQQLVDRIKNLHLDALGLSTDVELVPLYAPISGEQNQYVNRGEVVRQVVGYAVDYRVSATIHGDVETLRKAAAQIVDAGLTSNTIALYGPIFYKEDQNPARREALEKAVADARANAEALAKGLGVSLTGYSYLSMYPPQQEAASATYDYLERGQRTFASAGQAPLAPSAGPSSLVEIQAQEVGTFVYLGATYK